MTGYVIVIVIDWPTGTRVTVQAKKPNGNETPAGLPGAVKAASGTAARKSRLPADVEKMTSPRPVAEATRRVVMLKVATQLMSAVRVTLPSAQSASPPKPAKVVSAANGPDTAGIRLTTVPAA